MTTPDHSAELDALVGQPAGPPTLAHFPINEPMIRHWYEAMGDENPVYHDPDVAAQVGLDGIIAPPTMQQAWIMVGLKGTLERESARFSGEVKEHEHGHETMMRLCDEEGRTSVVATNCTQEYTRQLRVGEHLAVTSTIDAISGVKSTGLGVGRFITTRTDFYVVAEGTANEEAAITVAIEQGEHVGSMYFRILKFVPHARPAAKPPRPHPAITEDTAYYWEGLADGRLLLQRCISCGTLRHPSLPACGACGSLEWDTVESKGEGEIYSYVVVHYPQVPSFDYPLPIGLIALDEGTRIVANLDCDPSAVAIGTRVTMKIEKFDDELSLPVFSPVGA